jgi:organic hydroperoxide reductase OsmC/OhrA
MTPEQFQETAKQAEGACPVSNALRSIKIELDASAR